MMLRGLRALAGATLGACAAVLLAHGASTPTTPINGTDPSANSASSPGTRREVRSFATRFARSAEPPQLITRGLCRLRFPAVTPRSAKGSWRGARTGSARRPQSDFEPVLQAVVPGANELAVSSRWLVYRVTGPSNDRLVARSLSTGRATDDCLDGSGAAARPPFGARRPRRLPRRFDTGEPDRRSRSRARHAPPAAGKPNRTADQPLGGRWQPRVRPRLRDCSGARPRPRRPAGRRPHASARAADRPARSRLRARVQPSHEDSAAGALQDAVLDDCPRTTVGLPHARPAHPGLRKRPLRLASGRPQPGSAAASEPDRVFAADRAARPRLHRVEPVQDVLVAVTALGTEEVVGVPRASRIRPGRRTPRDLCSEEPTGCTSPRSTACRPSGRARAGGCRPELVIHRDDRLRPRPRDLHGGRGRQRAETGHGPAQRSQEPAWSPDGTRLAYASRRGGNWDIYGVTQPGANVVSREHRPPRDIRRGRRTAPTSRSSGKRTTAGGSSSTRGTVAPRQGSPQARATTSTPPGHLTEHSSTSWEPETVGPASGASTLPAARRKLSVIQRGSKMHRPGAQRVGPGDRASTLARMPDLPLTGGCLCGGVRFEVTEPLVSSGYCHCTRCQRRTGTGASASGADRAGLAAIVSGRGADPVVRPPDDGFSKVFCASAARRCGVGARTTPRSRRPPRRIRRRPGHPARVSASSSPMPRRGSRSRTTGCRGTPSTASSYCTSSPARYR